MRFEDKVVVVTGGGNGIGEAYAKAFAREGASVVIAEIEADRGERVAEEIVAAGGHALAITTDVADQDSTRALGAAVAGAHGGVDHLVNNAGIFRGQEMHSLMEVPLAYWNRHFAVSMTGALLVSQAIVPLMFQREGASVVNQSSTAAWMGGGYYGMAKLALHGFTHTLARELAPRGIRVNAIAPGPTQTAALDELPPDIIPPIVKTMAIQRIAHPDEMASAVLFLCSEAASFITGHVLNVDGGQMMRV